MSRLVPTDYRRFAEVLEWFVERRGQRSVPTGSPIQRWIASLRRVADGNPMSYVPHAANLVSTAAVSADSLAVAYDLYAACEAAHAIQTFKGIGAQGALEVSVSASFVTKELVRADVSELNRATMPAGVGTLLAAAEVARLREGSLRILGDGSPGMDIEWVGDDGQTIRIEAKARAFSRAFDVGATPRLLLRWLGSQVRDASVALRSHSRNNGVDALHVVQLTAFLPVELARAMPPSRAVGRIRDEIMRIEERDRPHAVVARWYGIDIEEREGVLISVAESLSHTIEVPFAEPPPTLQAITSFYRMVGLPVIYRPQLLSRETLGAREVHILAAFAGSRATRSLPM